MSFQITEAFVKDFRDGFTLRAQQLSSRLRGAVRVEMGVKGTEASFDYVGKRQPTQRLSRHADTVLADTPHDRRWVTLKVFDDADLIDKPDLVRTLTDPTNTYSSSMSAGFGRKIDESLMDVADATVKTGVAGAGTSAHPAASQIAAGGTGMTIAKIRQALRLLHANEQPEPYYWVYTARQEDDMFGITEVVSSDFNNVKPFANGMIRSFGGFNFIRVEDPILKISSGTDRKTFAFSGSALMTAFGMDIQASIDRRPDKNNSVQVFYSCDWGTTRLDDTGVIRILCTE